MAIILGSPAGAAGSTASTVTVNNFTFVPSITNLASNPLTVSGTTIAITSLPPLGAAIVSVNNFTFVLSITNLASVPLTVSGTTIAITSLPPLGAATVSLSPGGLISISAGAVVSVTNLVSTLESDNSYRVVIAQAAPITGYWRFTSTYTSAQTNAVLVNLPTSTTALHITDLIFSSGDTHGSLSLIESPSGSTIRPVLDRIWLRNYGGAVINFSKPLVLDTNSALCFTTTTVTSHSVTGVGYTA